MLVVLSVLGGAAAIVGACRLLARPWAFRGRSRLPLRQMFTHTLSGHQMTYETFERVYQGLGRCYRVDPELIRPTDPIKLFMNLDSWDLWHGTQQFDSWLLETFNIDPSQRPEAVLDLLMIAETAGQRDQGPRA
jgi:hypothetical protein